MTSEEEQIFDYEIFNEDFVSNVPAEEVLHELDYILDGMNPGERVTIVKRGWDPRRGRSR